jgi:hypothetical protein
MDECAVQLLGMLKMQSQDSQQINECVEHSLDRIADMKQPTVYAILDWQGHGGHIAERTEQ